MYTVPKRQIWQKHINKERMQFFGLSICAHEETVKEKIEAYGLAIKASPVQAALPVLHAVKMWW
jgi:hypothetical protein